MKYDNYGLLADCSSCMNYEFKRMERKGISPTSIRALKMVTDSLKPLDDEASIYSKLCEYALAACFWVERRDDEVQ